MGDRGYFPRGESVLRRVHGTKIVGVAYGQRALLMQATHPLAFTGLIASTDGLEAPFQRLAHTAKAMETVYFGTCAEADRVTRRVRAMHTRVAGTLDTAAGPHPAGAAYRADSPEFLLWILACLADSAQRVYEACVRPLSAAEREDLWSDYVRVGELFGLTRGDAPATYAGYRAYVDEQLASAALFVTEEAHALGLRVAFDLPVPASRERGLAVINFLVRGVLPPRVRGLYGLAWDDGDERRLNALTAGLRLSARVTPARLRRGSSAREYDVVARTELRRLGRI